MIQLSDHTLQEQQAVITFECSVSQHTYYIYYSEEAWCRKAPDSVTVGKNSQYTETAFCVFKTNTVHTH